MRPESPDDYGKINQAFWLTETFPEALEADLQRYYGTDLRMLGAGLSWRRMLVLVENLPPESALMTAIRNTIPEDELAARESHPERAPWSALETLLAVLIDEVRSLTWVQVQKASQENVPRPEPLRRPGVRGGPRRRLRVLTGDEARKLDPRLRGIPDDKIQETINGMIGRGK